MNRSAKRAVTSSASAVSVSPRRTLGLGLLAGLARPIVAGALAERFDSSIGVTPFLGDVAVGDLSMEAVQVVVVVENRLVAPSTVVGLALAASACADQFPR